LAAGADGAAVRPGMDVSAIAEVAFTREDRGGDVIRNFNADGFRSLYPKYKGGHPPKFTLSQRREIKKIAKSLCRAKTRGMGSELVFLRSLGRPHRCNN
jgi:transposase